MFWRTPRLTVAVVSSGRTGSSLDDGRCTEHGLGPRLRALIGKNLRINPDGNIRDNPIPGSLISFSTESTAIRKRAGWELQTKRLDATEHGPTGEKGRPPG